MADSVKWIKITTDIFDDEKILMIESLPSADSIIVIWFKLLALAGKQNNSGVFLMNDRIAYTDEMLATIFRRDLNTVRLALKTFEAYGMIEIVDNVITIPNWGKHQNLDQLENRREYMRNYMDKYREKQKKIACKTNSKTNSKTNVNKADKEIDIEEDIEEEKERDNNLIVSNDTICQTQGVQRVVDEWNTLSEYGIKSVLKLTSGSQRRQMLVARIKQYGVEEVLLAIGNIKNSDFLQGKNKRGWTITFDWFVRPNNFPKVLEGQYDDDNRNSNNNSFDMERWLADE